jgi:hypothetical protein
MLVEGIGVENRLGAEIDVHLDLMQSRDGKNLLKLVIRRKGDALGVVEVAQPGDLHFIGPTLPTRLLN